MTITRGRARQPHACIADLFPSPPPTASASRRWSPMARRELFLALLCIAASALATGADAADARKMVGVYELRKGDFSVKVTNWGARLMSVVFPDSKGALPAAVLSPTRLCSIAGSRDLVSLSCRGLNHACCCCFCREFG